MMRLLLLAALAVIACRVILGKWPWEYLRGAPTREQALLQARRLLGVSATATAREIRDAHRRMVAMVHPDRNGGSNVQLQEVNAARDLLLNNLPPEMPERQDEP